MYGGSWSTAGALGVKSGGIAGTYWGLLEKNAGASGVQKKLKTLVLTTTYVWDTRVHLFFPLFFLFLPRGRERGMNMIGG